MKYSNPTVMPNTSKSIYDSKLKRNPHIVDECSLEDLNEEDFKKMENYIEKNSYQKSFRKNND